MEPNSPELTFAQMCVTGFQLYFGGSIESSYNQSGEYTMKISNLMRSIPVVLAVLTFGMPAQAGMVATAQLQQILVVQESPDMNGQRTWIEAQLLQGGVEKADATARVAALTDAEISMIYQRIDEAPAGGSGILVIALVIFATLEITGYIDVIPER
jgi:hypothetical protein